MKKITTLIATLIIMLSLAPTGRLFAQLDACNDNDINTPCNVLDPVCKTNPTAAVCESNLDPQNPENNSIYGEDGIIITAANIIAVIAGVAAVLVIMIGGLQYILASGDPTKINNAKNIILYAIIGLVIIVAARSIIVLVIRGL